MDDNTPKPTGTYNPSPEERKARYKTYNRIDRMRELKDKAFPHFAGPDGERSFNTYIDDSERILNGYTFSRESQGKEDWQSNMLDNITRAKLRGVAASVGLKVPEMRFSAVDTNGIHSSTRADIFQHITKQSFLDGNPSLSNFNEVWHLLSHGIVFEYEGYQTGGAMQRKVKSFDSRTGAVEEESVYVEGKGKPFNALLNPQEFFWWDMFVSDVQDQPHVGWVQHYTKTELEREFSKFPNYKYVRDKRQILAFANIQDSLYFTKWSTHVENENDYEVIRFYSKEDDSYEIWINGVCVLLAPLLWGDEDKYYPFAKSIAEPFANTNFFAGMSLPGILEPYQDQRNTLVNTMADILYRQASTPLLVGLGNKDILDFEGEFVSQDNRYYVPDVNAVKPMPVTGLSQADFAFLSIIDRGIESLSIDSTQQGVNQQGAQPTARAAVIADERARELKGILYLFLEDLWLQKYRLRNRTVLTHYLKDKAARKSMKDQIITVPDYCFYNGERGTLDIHIAKTKADLLSEVEITAREDAATQQGEVYKLISIMVSYMDDWHFDYQIVPQSFHTQDRLRTEDEFNSEVQWTTTLYPEFFVANKDKYLEEKLAMRGKHPEDFNPPAKPPPMPMAPGAPGAAPGAPAGPGQPTPTPAPAPAAATNVLGLPQ